MIFSLALCLGLMAAATAVQTTEDGQESRDLDMMNMVEVNETLVVYKRKHTQNTKHRCLSAKKQHRESDTQYQYELRARLGGQYYAQTVNVTLDKDQGGVYKSRYTDRDGINYNLTLKEMDPAGPCFVIFVNKDDGNKGCELLVTASNVNGTIPEKCKNYYSQHCEGKSSTLHRPRCIYN
uniref:Secreted protein n=1 Tax=Amblyomma cajennense TaxID=34607 RepID=A0A023FQI2_AMBCJ